MSASLTPYLNQVRHSLQESLENMSVSPNAMETCTLSRKQKYPLRPVVEISGIGSVEKRTLRHSSKEFCLLESSANSLRLSVAFKQQHSDVLDQTILAKYMKFFQQRANSYAILRRVPLNGFSITFLVTSEHVEKFGMPSIVDTIVDFLSLLDRECSHVKISVNARARLVATEFLNAF